MFRKVALTVLLAGLSGSSVLLEAAPRLGIRLPQPLDRTPCESLGTCPIWIGEGQNGPPGLIIQAVNEGDGQLNVQATGAPSTWLGAAVGSPNPCPFDLAQTCQAIALQLNTAALPKGEHFSELKITADGAENAPRQIPIRVRIGGDIPDRLDFWVPPVQGAADVFDFQTPEGPTPDFAVAGSFLSVTSNGLGSFRFLHTHRVIARYDSATVGAGDNNGSITVSGSTFAGDNRQVPVTLHVVSGPIARLSADSLSFTTAEGIAAGDQFLGFSNGGSGDLTVDNLTVSTESGGDWLTAAVPAFPGFIQVSAAVDGLAAGLYSGSIRIDSNAANAPFVIPVSFTVDPAGPPEASIGGAVDGATFDQPVSPGSLISIFGEQLAYQTAGATETPLPTELGGASVQIDGVAAPMVFASYGQMNVQVPYEVGPGTRVIVVSRDGQAGNSTTVPVQARVPRLFYLNRGAFGEYGAMLNATQGNSLPLPPDLVPPGANAGPAQPGDVISIFATGLGTAVPAVATGAAAPASPLSMAVDVPRVSFARTPLGPTAMPDFVGLAPGFVGLWQINVTLPDNLPTDEHTPVAIEYFDGGRRSNTVEIPVQR